ncbi:hypothetical protein [Amycolatopsis taiwanensis]|uniref:hypothetical protein n=1 Tax=Amycolatopsis taiwanensis TaxID=342230 RepID=UPI000487F1EB|nr:hypothetical protein [Amycolatopsis taiwanensis]
MPSSGQATLVIRLPDRVKRRAKLLALPVAAAIVVPATIARQLSGFCTGAVIATIVLVPVFFYVYRARIIVTPTEIGKAGLLGRVRTRSRAELDSVVRATLPPPPRGDGRPVHNVFLLDRSGQRVMRFTSSPYAPGDLDRVVDELGLPVSTLPGIVTAKQLRERYPKILPWAERRPFVAGLTLIAATFVIIAVVVTAAGGGHHGP